MPKLVDHDARRIELLESSFNAFARKGYGSVSTRALCKEIGVTTGTLYHYFDSKEAVFVELVRHRVALDVQEATGHFTEEMTPADRLADLALFVARRTDRLADTLRLVLEFARYHDDDGSREFIHAMLESYRTPMREAGVPLGLSLILGMLVHKILDEGATDVGEHLQFLLKLGR